MKAEQLTEPVCYHGEGPVWSEAWGGLRWVDMLDGDVMSLGADGSVDRRHVDNIAALVRPRRGGGAVLAIERGFALEDPDGALTRLGDVWSNGDVRMNEGGCDPDGRFYCGSMAYDKRPGGGSLVSPRSGWRGHRGARRASRSPMASIGALTTRLPTTSTP